MLLPCSSVGFIPQAAIFHCLCQCPSMGRSSLQTAQAWVTPMRGCPCAPVVDPPGAGGGYLLHCGSPWAEENPCSTALRTSCPSIFIDFTSVSTGLFLISLTPLSHSCHAASLSFPKYAFPEVLPSWLRASTMPCGGSIGSGWSQQLPAIPQLPLPLPGHQLMDTSGLG